MNLYHLGVTLALIAYAVSSILYLQSFVLMRRRETALQIAYGCLLLGTLLMTANCVNAFQHNLSNILAIFILIASIGWMSIFGKMLFDIKILGAIVAPLSTIIMLVQFLFFQPHGPVTEQAPSALLYTHIFVSIAGEAFAIIAFVISVFYLMQQRALKAKQVQKLQFTQVTISKLHSTLITTLSAGFILMTCGLIMGAIYQQFYLISDRSALMGKIIWAFMIWIWYMAILVGRNMMNISGRKLAWMTIIGFMLLAIGTFGITNWSKILG